jgi:hypothetical protein
LSPRRLYPTPPYFEVTGHCGKACSSAILIPLRQVRAQLNKGRLSIRHLGSVIGLFQSSYFGSFFGFRRIFVLGPRSMWLTLSHSATNISDL